MRKTAIRIDEDLASRAKSVLGTKTLTATVNEALRSVVDRALREALIEHLSTPGAFDFDVIEDAWRKPSI